MKDIQGGIPVCLSFPSGGSSDFSSRCTRISSVLVFSFCPCGDRFLAAITRFVSPALCAVLKLYTLTIAVGTFTPSIAVLRPCLRAGPGVSSAVRTVTPPFDYVSHPACVPVLREYPVSPARAPIVHAGIAHAVHSRGGGEEAGIAFWQVSLTVLPPVPRHSHI